MDPILYSVVDGGTNDLIRQDIIANNLANLNTPGFRANLYEAQVMYLNDQNGNTPTNGATFIVQMPSAIDLSPGGLMTTGRPLDIAITGNGFLAVQGPDGQEKYTRGGSFSVNANGQLVTATGDLVLGDGGAIAIPPASSVEVAGDGTISIVPLGSDARNLVALDRIRVVTLNNVGLTRGTDGFVQLGQGSAIVETDPNIKVVGGALEDSNVNAIEQLVQMISANRDFEAQMKILTTVNENADKLAQLLQT